LSRELLPEFQKGMEPLLGWADDPSASPRKKVASLTSRDLEGLQREKRK
jgi:hypothetical protein